jgi:hypothetical protein
MFDDIMMYSAVDITLYIKCMLWSMCDIVDCAIHSRAIVMTRFTFVKKKKKKLTIVYCPFLLQRYNRDTGMDWAKIAHIRELDLR